MSDRKFRYQVGCILALLSILLSYNLNVEAAGAYSVPDTFLLSQPENTVTPNVSALELFRKAYESRYTWNAQFPGYTAEVEFKQGKNEYKGKVQINPDLSVEVTGIDDEEANQTVKNQLLMLGIHRRKMAFEVAHKNKTFKFGAAKNPRVVEIIEEGGKTTARYQIANSQIRQVQRQLGTQNVVVNTLNTEITPEGYIATQYQSTFRDAQTSKLAGEETSSDTYKKVGNYYVLAHQVIQHNEDGDRFEAEFSFSEIKLM
jgi:Protein of unknown function (DUF3386)